MILGVTGPIASGKGEVAKYLATKGFVTWSLSDVIRDEATARGLDHSRDVLVALGNELRAGQGPSVLAQRILLKLKTVREKNPDQKVVIESFRHPAEVEVLKQCSDFVLLLIDAPIELRFSRLAERNRLGDAKSVDELRDHEARENSTGPNQQLRNVFALADACITNESTEEELYAKLDAFVGAR